MKMRALIPLSVIAALFLGGLQGCVTKNPATDQQVFTGGMTEQDEINIGRQNHPQIIKSFGGEYKNPTVTAYVNSVGQLLARTVERRNFKYKFTVLNSGIVNAFALPGGYIYISRGLMALAEDEAEMAAVLAHELGHVNALHHARRQGQQVLAGVLLTGVGIAAGREAADLGNIVASGVLSSWSREHELESDLLGLRYLARAGYDPKAVPDFLAKMRSDARLEAKRQGQSPDAVDQFNYLGTHPAPIERVRIATEEALKFNVKNPDRSRDVYLRKINGMLYGDDPEQGFIRGRVFAHPKLRFRFEVPKDFSLFNSPSAVIAKGPDEATIIFDNAKKTADGPVSYYISNVWARGLALKNIQKIDVNGLEGATAQARISTRGGQRDVRLVAIRKDLQTIYRFAFFTKPGQQGRYSTPFRRTTYSFRILTRSEAEALKPLRVRAVRVRSGDTVKSLAARMEGDSRFKEERFRTINGMGPQEKLRRGEMVKLITE